MLNVNLAGLNPDKIAKGIDRNMSPIGHRKAYEGRNTNFSLYIMRN
jgi:hypothetical protein